MTTSARLAVVLAVVLWAPTGAVAAQDPTVGSACLRGARLESFGLATGGVRGPLELDVEGAPVFGLPFRFVVRNGVPGAHGLLAFGSHESPMFMPPFGATIYPSYPILLALPFDLDANGASPPLFDQLPVTPALCGSAFVVQAVAADASATGGAGFTKGVRLRFGAGSGGALFDPSAPQFVAQMIMFDTEVADLNGDQLPDVAFVAVTDDHVIFTDEDEAAYVLYGAGDGTFTSGQVLPTGNEINGRMALGDVDGDGTRDIVTSSGDTSSVGGVRLLLNDGAGGFLPPALVIQEQRSLAIAVADLNADGQADLVYARDDDVRVLLGTGGGAFLPPVAFPVDHRPLDLEVADLDLDGVLDVATANADTDDDFDPSSVSLLLGLGDGTFAPHQTLPTGLPDVMYNTAAEIEPADFGLDGFPDLAALVIMEFADHVSLFEGLGAGAFAAAVNHPAGNAAQNLRVADADRDLHPDAILGSWVDAEAVRILRGLPDGTLAPYVPYGFGYQTFGLGVGDLDGDFMPDLVLSPVDPGQIFVAPHQLLP